MTILPLILALAGSIAQSDGWPAAPEGDGRFFVDLVAERRVEALPAGPLYWRIETFPSAAEASAAGTADSLTASIAGRHWLFTLGPRGDAARATLVAEIGPVSAPSARSWLLRINRAGGPPGASTPVHAHPGSEAIYVLSGQISQRTAHGTDRADAGEALAAHAPGMAMQLASSGATDLEQLVMFVVDAERPFSERARFEQSSPEGD